jgi:hypothetical protein
MILDLPDLRILPLSSLLPHEENDRQRTQPLVNRLQSDGNLRNPPIVAPPRNGSEKYVVLDGINRIAAFQTMNLPHILVQVAQPYEPHLILNTWNHLIWGMTVDAFMTGIHSIKGLRVQPTKDESPPDFDPECTPIQFLLPEGKTYFADLTPDVNRIAALLRAVVSSYKNRANIDRTSQIQIEALKSVHRDLTALIIFPSFDVNTVFHMALNGCLLPSGITRFIVSPRALHVNYPLEELASPKTTAEKNTRLQKWIQECLLNKSVRYYAEATFLFDD